MWDAAFAASLSRHRGDQFRSATPAIAIRGLRSTSLKAETYCRTTGGDLLVGEAELAGARRKAGLKKHKKDEASSAISRLASSENA
jgi:hypothetical protein